MNEKAIDEFEEFLECDLPSKIFPMDRMTGQTMFREDYFESPKDVEEYIKLNFKAFRDNLFSEEGDEK